jgi:hypothetical protein
MVKHQDLAEIALRCVRSVPRSDTFTGSRSNTLQGKQQDVNTSSRHSCRDLPACRCASFCGKLQPPLMNLPAHTARDAPRSAAYTRPPTASFDYLHKPVTENPDNPASNQIEPLTHLAFSYRCQFRSYIFFPLTFRGETHANPRVAEFRKRLIGSFEATSHFPDAYSVIDRAQRRLSNPFKRLPDTGRIKLHYGISPRATQLTQWLPGINKPS